MGKTYAFSKPNEICKEMELSLLATIPAMDELAMCSFYDKSPLIQNTVAFEQLAPAYSVLQKHLLSEDIIPSKQTENAASNAPSKLKKWLNLLKVTKE